MTTASKKVIITLSSILFMVVIIACYENRYQIYYKYLGGHPTVVMFGSTLTRNGHWGKLLSRPDVVNRGLLNVTTAQMLDATEETVIHSKPKICFVEGGCIDLAQGIPLKDIEENMSAIIKLLKNNSVLPVIELNAYSAADTGFNKRVDSLNQSLMDLSRQTGAEYIDLNSALSLNGFLQKQYARNLPLFTVDAYPHWAPLVTQVLHKYKIN